jgi:hypothetical protein
MRRAIDQEITGLEGGPGFLRSREVGGPQDSPHPGQELIDTERLGHIVVGAYV